jgi:hypothetical protein
MPTVAEMIREQVSTDAGLAKFISEFGVNRNANKCKFCASQDGFCYLGGACEQGILKHITKPVEEN